MAPQEHGVHVPGERREHHIRRPGFLDHFSLDARGEQPLARAVEHRRSILAAGLAHVGHEDGAAKPVAQYDSLLECRVGARASIETHQQAGEHG